MRRIPFGEEVVRASRTHLDELDTAAFFNARHAVDLLHRHGVRCPAFPDYAPNLVAFAQRRIEGWDPQARRLSTTVRSLRVLGGRPG